MLFTLPDYSKTPSEPGFSHHLKSFNSGVHVLAGGKDKSHCMRLNLKDLEASLPSGRVVTALEHRPELSRLPGLLRTCLQSNSELYVDHAGTTSQQPEPGTAIILVNVGTLAATGCPGMADVDKKPQTIHASPNYHKRPYYDFVIAETSRRAGEAVLKPVHLRALFHYKVGGKEHPFVFAQLYSQHGASDILGKYGADFIVAVTRNSELQYIVLPLQRLRRRIYVMPDPAAPGGEGSQRLRFNPFKWDRETPDWVGADEVTPAEAGVASDQTQDVMEEERLP